MRLKLKVNLTKSAAARPCRHKLLGYSMTTHYKPKLKAAPATVQRFKARLRGIFRRGRGKNLRRVIVDLNEATLGWVNCFRLAQVKGISKELGQRMRRRLRCISWRQWKQPWTRAKRMLSLALDEQRACISTVNGRGA